MKSKKMKKVIIFGLILVILSLVTPTCIVASSVQEQIPFNSNLESGDILFMDIRSLWLNILSYGHIKGYSNDHCALYMGNPFGIHWFVESSNYSILGIINYLDGVQISPKWWLKIIFTNFTYAKLHNATNKQKELAIKFAINQIPESYQDGWINRPNYDTWHANPDISDPENPYYEKYYNPNDPYINYWTCAELVWASYLNQGIEIDSTPNLLYDDSEDDYFYFVGTNDIRNSENVTIYEFK